MVGEEFVESGLNFFEMPIKKQQKVIKERKDNIIKDTKNKGVCFAFGHRDGKFYYSVIINKEQNKYKINIYKWTFLWDNIKDGTITQMYNNYKELLNAKIFENNNSLLDILESPMYYIS